MPTEILGIKVMRIRLEFLCEDRDRHGNVRCYVRMPGKPKVRIRALPGTPEFLEEYHAAISAAAPDSVRQANEAKKGSFRDLWIRYYASAAYRTLDGSTQSWQRRALDEIAQEHAAKPVAMMQARHVRRMRDAKSATPAAANRLAPIGFTRSSTTATACSFSAKASACGCSARNGNDWSDRFPLITEAALRNRISSFVIDGEAVLLGVNRRADLATRKLPSQQYAECLRRSTAHRRCLVEGHALHLAGKNAYSSCDGEPTTTQCLRARELIKNPCRIFIFPDRN
jgi:hypothetical protein